MPGISILGLTAQCDEGRREEKTNNMSVKSFEDSPHRPNPTHQALFYTLNLSSVLPSENKYIFSKTFHHDERRIVWYSSLFLKKNLSPSVLP